MPDGWVIAYCSLDACKKEEERGRVWEGPTRGKRCSLGFNKETARRYPAVIFYHPQTGLRLEAKVPVQWMTNKVWNCVVEWFSQEREMVRKEKSFNIRYDIEIKVREVINQTWNT